ncbi:bifunctional UDP-N-acetylmuramoyl-L-alanyl-D-glutamate--2,6-diaminopimelate ligase MurE/UDP-N-acetylmuramoyl-tripeptide--D-alanyl-D-alanine ligase MurF [Candidimonas sp. SYP-B2681]|uniref:bifunctional UDP-N-acetylmuramoyl-L-alanyl-D-glutamate--2, 6-diaminopimelate ligase MurE/UDP-N-acetylmuramoyl-tripeptide--D-alanyl-D-alanine ligase MurF n=1 Tax=Candidimonas sp. SYP-B2681 TaxID=2497686 RepID=UPI000F897CE1|nr:bifunctional UDP-N-acetylmuramoyl-L-alanyl-D-glutamate--2,6-diaminopimelate ligase MurE/UDP-N-acetylmuramoyl-tripeptide--D-alanyl-D-alanine ligase MurF [Candidimonas sp. SYP-B2681]RTZ44768.1 bifunctional UDP-N-acetylmuramoyl-L-alanyl-D-glutamate--2,6-diaminopimelate ligase MurE/UDP-N-acetylmuramoyl-tripeptide--D-alanyl-D-alanine ligase MurF [Candidimonas sp. SYP-B2681]
MIAQEIISWLNQHVIRTAHLCLDSRQLHAGDVFFACPGLASDGRLFIQHALDQGAAAVVYQSGDDITVLPDTPTPVLAVPDLNELLGLIAHLWYGEPSLALSVVAVTGTNGKTTCVQWIASALNSEGIPCGTVGTLGVCLPDGTNLGGALTTPDVLTMHRSLAAMRDAGAAVVAVEASSIGIEQGRLLHVHIEVAAFTNLTHDHLDYHGTLHNYKLAKFALFETPGLGAAVINLDDPAGVELAQKTSLLHPVTYSLGRDAAASLQAHEIQTGSYGLVFKLCSGDGTAQLLTRLVGEHNISNLLLVSGVLQQLGWELPQIARVLATLRSVEGRLQIVDAPSGSDSTHTAPLVVVDYAHTPDALERALVALRDVAKARNGRLVCVFGCGGGRDNGKRPLMGGIASTLADTIIVTNDNPRMEDPQAIVDQIWAGMPHTPHIELDRALAIMEAIWNADINDVVLLAGKGHETYQESQGLRVAFDDREWARFALTWRGGLTLSTDSRNIRAGQLFVALKGDSFDGHEYLAQVQEAGASAAVVSHYNASVTLPQFVLGDTRQALIRISTAWRRLFLLPVIGVTGSNGKTTTKEMIASIFRAWIGDEASLATQGNLNNDIGVPLSVLRMSNQHRAAVLELGMNHPGEIALLANIAQPTVALVNNAQREHQEFMHTVEAVAAENGAVITALPADGVAVFPGDDTYTDLWRSLAGKRKVIDFGFEPRFAVYADEIQAEATRTVCQLHTPKGNAGLVLSAPGLHNLRNALAAAACASAAGTPVADIVLGLEAFSPVSGRMQPHQLTDGFQLIDDTYNANPDSVRAAIDVLAQLEGKKILVLGDMAEVGANSDAMHAEVGAYAHERAIDVLLTFGPACKFAARAFGPQAQAFDSIEALSSHLKSLVPANILVKGSRSTHMERVVHAFETQSMNKEEGTRHAT